MDSPIVGYHKDEENDWVAELACGHLQHKYPHHLKMRVSERLGRFNSRHVNN
jgi:hypothetical protein